MEPVAVEQEELERHRPQTDLQHLVGQLDFRMDLVLVEPKVELVEEALVVELHMDLELAEPESLLEVEQIHRKQMGRQQVEQLVA